MFELLTLVAYGQTFASWCVKLLVGVFLLDVLVFLTHSPRIRYYACYVCYIMTCMTLAIFYIPILALRFNDPSNVIIASPPIVILAKLLGIEYDLRGTKNLVKDDGSVLAVNHQSMFDILGLLAVGYKLERAWAVARKEVFYFWPFGLAIWLSGIIFIDRNKGKEANQMLMESIVKVREQRTKLVMFPEGTRNRKGGHLLPFKKGAFRMAIQGQVPIQPLVMSPYYFINSEKKLFHRGKIIMSVLPPISTKGKTMADLDMLLEKTHAVMEEEYQKLRAEIEDTYGPFKT